MTSHSVKYGIDRCPATKNYSHATFCRYCDFRAGEAGDCCKCVFAQFGKKQRDELNHLTN